MTSTADVVVLQAHFEGSVKTFELPLRAARMCGIFSEALEEDPDMREMPLLDVPFALVPELIDYMVQSVDAAEEEKFKFCVRKVRGPNLLDSGVPQWAVAFVSTLPPRHLVPLMHHALNLRVTMLHELISAWLAACVFALADEGLNELYKMPLDEHGKRKEWTQEMLNRLKASNDWAWAENVEHMVDDINFDKEEMMKLAEASYQESLTSVAKDLFAGEGAGTGAVGVVEAAAGAGAGAADPAGDIDTDAPVHD